MCSERNFFPVSVVPMNWLRRSAALLLLPAVLAGCKDSVSPNPDPVPPEEEPVQPAPPGTPGTPGQPAPPPPSTPTNPPPSTPSNPAVGVLGFSVSGALTGTFDARGQFQSGASRQTTSFAAAAGDASRLSIAAFHLVNPPRGNVFLLEIRNAQGVQSVPIQSRDACVAGTAPCAYGVFVVNREPATEVTQVNDPQAFVLTSGTISTLEIAGGRARGVFAGQATRSSSGEVVTFADGGFDVPVVSS